MPPGLRERAARLPLSPPPLLPRSARGRRLFARLGMALVVVAVALGALGEFWLPGLLKAQLETRLGEVLQRDVQVAAVDISPHRLAVQIRGLQIADRPGSDQPTSAQPAAPLLAFDRLDVDLSVASIARRAPVISALRLSGLQVHLVRAADGRLSIADIVERLQDLPPAPPTAEPARFSVSNIEVVDSRLRFTDHLKNSVQEVSDIRVGLPFLANFAADEATWVQPHFSARINGDPVRFDGQLKPFADIREATLQVALTGVDLTALEAYAALPAGLDLLSGRLDARLAARFSQTPDGRRQLRLSGEATLAGFALHNSASRAPSEVHLDALHLRQIDVDALGDAPLRARAELVGLRVQHRGALEPVLVLPAARLAELAIDRAGRRIALAPLTLDRLQVALRRERDDSLDLANLFAPRPGAGKASATATAAPAQPAAAGLPPWQITLARLRLTDAALRFEDRTLKRPVPLTVTSLEATATDLDLSGQRPLTLSLDATINRDGRLATRGTIAWAPLALDLAIDARNVELVALQGWAAGRVNALLTRGAASFDGVVQAAGTPLKLAVRGDARLSGVNLLDRADAADLLRWKRLEIAGLQFANAPLDLRIRQVALADFFADVRLSPEGRLNLAELVGPPPADRAASPTAMPSAPPPQASPAAPAPAQALPIRIDRVTLAGGAVNFDDRFIRPNYQARLTGLAGTIGPLQPGQPGDVAIRGAVNRAAPLSIDGKLDPFGAPLFLDIAASAKGIDLPGLSPYSGKYVGYAIEKGKLSVDVRYHVEQGELRADNDIFLDQLTFGEPVDSPGALKLPVHLAVALLKNPRGEIDIRLPISGSLNDPEFSVGGIIVKVLVNLVVKAVTSPFALLGSLFGGEQDLSAVDFEAGRARLSPETESRLGALAKAMAERPGLRLEVSGQAVPVADRDGLRRALLDRQVRARKLAAAAQRGQAAGSLREVEVSADEYPRYLGEVYADADMPKPRNALGLLRSLPPAEMEKLLLAHMPADDDALRQLAERRAAAVRTWLVEQGGVAAERVFVLAPQLATNEAPAPGRVVFSLR